MGASGTPRGRGRGAWISRGRGQRPNRGRGLMRGGERFFAHVKCYNCNEMGHYANDCKVANRNPNAAGTTSNSNPQTHATVGRGLRGLRVRGAPRSSPAQARGLSRKRPHPGGESEPGQPSFGTPKVARSENSEW